MVAQQKINESSSLECVGTEVLPSPVAATTKGNSPGSPKSRLAMLKRSSTRTKANAASNDPFRFQGNGVDFKGKFIGERDVSEARGDAMCAEAMRLAKATVKSSGSHKQRIILNISIEGLKIKDEKSGSILYNFPVSKISFIARDTTDARAFGFIFGATDSNYKFYGIKTAQTADHAVLSIRDMFQVVFEMKKKQIKEVKQKKEEQENLENMQREAGEKNGASANGGEADGTRMDGGVAVADLLDLESELQNLEQGFNQLQNIPSMPEDDSSDNFFLAQWNANGSNTNVITAGAGNGNSGDPFDDSFFNSAPPAFGVSQTNSLNSSSGSGSGSGGSIVNGSGLMDGGIVPTMAPVNGALQSQPIFSCTNPFAAPSQSNGGIHHNGYHHHQVANGHHFAGNGNGGVDPFDTQSAHRVINAINSAHSYGFLPPPLSLQQQQQQHSSTMVTLTQMTAPPQHPLPSAFGAGPFGGGMSFNTNNGDGMTVAPSAKENTAPSMFDNTNGFAVFDKSSIQLNNGGDVEKRVTTLEEAFTKLVDMDQLVSTVTTASGTENSRKNPFEHIINPPKMPLNALLTHFP